MPQKISSNIIPEKLYQPSQKILEKYAKVLVNFALNDGKGINPGDVVRISASESARLLYGELYKAVIQSGGHVMSDYYPDNTKNFNLSRFFYEHANETQLTYFPAKVAKARVETMDHSIVVLADAYGRALEGVNPEIIMKSNSTRKPVQDWLRDKENAGKFTWTLALYGTQAMADEAKLTLKEYWQQIIKACFLDQPDPIAVWKKVFIDLGAYQERLNNLTQDIEWYHVHGEDADLWIRAGEQRKWNGGSGRNIPSFELFTSPDWRDAHGWIRFNQPLYRYGSLIEGIELVFEKGVVVSAKARKNQNVLESMLAVDGANKIGEFSMTDKRFSRITKFMAETLYDENVGGKFGNTHIALGNSYHDTFSGDITKMKKNDWKKLGFNDSVVHTDMVSTTDRVVTAVLKDGSEKVLYAKGEYQF